MRENYYRHECKRLREENDELKKQLKAAKEKEQEIDVLRDTYTDSIMEFIEAKNKYNKLVDQIRQSQKSQRKQFNDLINAMRKK